MERPCWSVAQVRMVWCMNSHTEPTNTLTFDECWELLADDILGRLALVVDGHPEIFPVNYVLDRRSIVFRSAGGSKLWGAQADRPAALEIDGYDPNTEVAWSVVVRGDTARDPFAGTVPNSGVIVTLSAFSTCQSRVAA